MTAPPPRYRWLLPDGVGPPASLLEALAARGLGPRVASVLAARGHLDAGAVAALLDPPASQLHPPRLLPDADRFLRRVRAARHAGERVLVFGDFDADGLCGLAILVRALRSLGLDAEPYVPDRATEGHGLSLLAVTRAADAGRSLIVTVDCGVSSAAEVDAARQRGIDVLISDHHRPPARLPAAVAIVDPHLPGSRYPHPDLCGAGVAFKLAQLLLEDEPGGPEQALALADLAAIGSVADVVPLVGETRAIVRLGLERIAAAPRPGLRALLRHAGIAPERVDAERIGFAVAPRLNSVGRLGDATAAVDLLLADDDDAAEAHAGRLEEANGRRRALLADCLAEARTVLAADPRPADPVMVLAGPWPVGLIGLLAGRLADEEGRPALVVSTQVRPWRVSARSAGGFDLVAAFTSCADLFERFGGHAAAAGADLEPDRLELLRQRLVVLAAGRPLPDPRPTVRVDLIVGAADVDHVLCRELAALEGTGDPPVLVGISGTTVVRTRTATGGHLQVVLRKGKDVLDGICFGRADELQPVLRAGAAIDLVGRLSVRRSGGFDTLDLEIHDIAPTGALRVGEAPRAVSPLSAVVA